MPANLSLAFSGCWDASFLPRLADAGASVFWRMDHDADYGVLNDIARGQSDPRKIVLQWDEMIRTAGSLSWAKYRLQCWSVHC
ncbi:Tn3 family transposase [Klebsiella quasipneumoniae]|uniref:Tn3 family transposase n=1 Tax=Klebsiella quasipneumoniae TaxID=1463165 RepID=UPI00388EFA70